MPLNMKSESGAAQVLGILVLSIAMLTGAIAVLQYAQNTTIEQIRQAKYSEGRAALSAAIQRAASIYRNEAVCDPAILNDKLSQMRVDGSLFSLNAEGGSAATLQWVQAGADPSTQPNPAGCPAPPNPNLQDPCSRTCGPPTCRRYDATINGETFQVSFGPIISPAFSGSNPSMAIAPNTRPDGQRGYSHDVEITVWTSVMGRRLVQRAVLVNNCTLPCTADLNAATGICMRFDPAQSGSWDDGHAYNTVDLAVRQSAMLSPTFSTAASFPGAIVSPGQSGPADLVLFKNYLRSGEWDSPGVEPATTAAAIRAVVPRVLDLDLDGRVDERDLGILEKLQRGYLYSVPTRCSYSTFATCGTGVSGEGTLNVD